MDNDLDLLDDVLQTATDNISRKEDTKDATHPFGCGPDDQSKFLKAFAKRFSGFDDKDVIEAVKKAWELKETPRTSTGSSSTRWFPLDLERRKSFISIIKTVTDKKEFVKLDQNEFLWESLKNLSEHLNH